MYDMMISASANRMPAGIMPIQDSVRNQRERSAIPAMDPISLAGAPRRSGLRRAGGNSRICSVRTAGERRCAFR